jgi:peptidoglycan DL-endopeptidase CwlO
VNVRCRHTSLLLLLASLLCILVFAPFASASPVAAKKARLHAVEARLQTVYAKADMAVERYNQAASKLQAVKAQITENQRLLKIAEYNLAIAHRELDHRAAALYKTRDVGFVDVLFHSNSFDDLVTQLNDMQRFGTNDVNTVKAIGSYRSTIQDKRLTLQADKQSAAKLVQQRAQQKQQVLSVQHQLEGMTRGIKAQIRHLEAQQAAAARAAAAQATAVVTDTSTGTAPSGGSSGGNQAVVAAAVAELGVPYVWGGESPSGFDCSGLAQWCYAHAGIGIPRTATAQQQASQYVPIGEAQPGDLVFFGGPGYSYHVGIYVGGGSMIAAPHTGAVVSYGSAGGAWCAGRF